MRRICMILFLVLTLTNCNDQMSLEEEIEHGKYESALILFAGEPAVDGCGWLIQMNDTLFSPLNLSTDFQVDSLRVAVSLKILDTTWNCGFRESGFNQVEIIEIKKQ